MDAESGESAYEAISERERSGGAEEGQEGSGTGRHDYGHELVRVKRVGRNPKVITCEIVYGPEAGKEVAVKVREAQRWAGVIGRLIEVEVGSMEPWHFRGKEPGLGTGDKRRIAAARRRKGAKG
jgi:hypothetical protein